MNSLKMIWIAYVIVGGLLILLLLRATRVAYTPGSLEVPIRGLLRQGYHGGLLTISVDLVPLRLTRPKKFLQLVKYIRGPGLYGIELAFPRARWSRDLYPLLRQLCDRERIAYRIAGTSPEDPLEFLFVDFGMNTNLAHSFVRKVLAEVFGIAANRKLYCLLQNATPEDRLVDS